MTKHGTEIEWTHVPGYRGATWIPIAGCDKVNEACRNCYAIRVAGTRLKNHPFYADTTRQSGDNLVWTGKVNMADVTDDRFTLPLRKQKPHAFFLTSMGDVFHEDVPDEYIDKLFAVMASTRRHLYIVLTKRPERMRDYLNTPARREIIIESAIKNRIRGNAWARSAAWPLPNVWLLTSVANQAEADEFIPPLLETPAAIRGLSIEPMVGPINLYLDALEMGDDGKPWYRHQPDMPHPCDYACGGIEVQGGIDWVIVGGESGPDARPTHPDWVMDVRVQCHDANVPFFFKQWGEWSPVADFGGALYKNELVLHRDGKQNGDGGIRQGGQKMRLVGKKAAGCKLGGMIYHAWPEVRQWLT